ncbi:MULTISPECIES: hypothetical protein [unclassified Variovorax]|uniref:hypothetical protein n=1 Tax=unclassified Variovorax TaxID=663243 RepID=UPI00076C5134|nr:MULTISPECIES: hypothetical protein [unclassified Variovorax]KWT87604.1 hypothetical protein APY03_3677 [Variovorax sp. WDL1]PNG51744.1 hypothetical protein CHC06_04866 [Variovorax sp. B2]PNG54092.1 hypothetical protein CHC07_03916 [Variovorax sp. B4]VTV11564.1 hypothetical protein WDL1CHR_02433 [Variovorax sp. WDL1]
MFNLLLQTTIEECPDDWNIARFSRLRSFLADLQDEEGHPLFRVTARDRTKRGEPDPVLSTLHESDYDQLWLLAVDGGDGLAPADCAGISQFRRLGGAMMITRDHMDLGSSICSLGGVGAAHHFHSRNVEPDKGRHCVDHPFSANILWPNYHSGANGDFQRIRSVGSIHPVMRDRRSPTGVIQYLPSHPHEGTVSAPSDDPSGRVIMEGVSSVSGRRFNIAVAFERSEHGGRAIAQSTFHHFADYNWDPSCGCPSFVTEPASDGLARFPEALRSTKQYVRNIALWLSA